MHHVYMYTRMYIIYIIYIYILMYCRHSSYFACNIVSLFKDVAFFHPTKILIQVDCYPDAVHSHVFLMVDHTVHYLLFSFI